MCAVTGCRLAYRLSRSRVLWICGLFSWWGRIGGFFGGLGSSMLGGELAACGLYSLPLRLKGGGNGHWQSTNEQDDGGNLSVGSSGS